MTQDLEGRIAIVTGAGGGIGEASALALAEAGAVVVATDVDGEAASRTAERVASAGGRAIARRLDVSVEDDWADTIAVARSLGRVTVLHGNAAVTSGALQALDNSVVDMDVAIWDQIMAVNVRGAMLGCKHTIPEMIAAGHGAIVITTSVAATLASLRTAYTTSKGALLSFMRSVATAHGPDGIRCNAVTPGFIETEATALLSPLQRADLRAANRVPYPGQPADIAATVRFLASDAARFLTGQEIVVDGGMSIHLPNIRRVASEE